MLKERSNRDSIIESIESTNSLRTNFFKGAFTRKQTISNYFEIFHETILKYFKIVQTMVKIFWNTSPETVLTYFKLFQTISNYFELFQNISRQTTWIISKYFRCFNLFQTYFKLVQNVSAETPWNIFKSCFKVFQANYFKIVSNCFKHLKYFEIIQVICLEIVWNSSK